MDEVRLKLLSMAEEPLWLKSGTLRLIPGSNAVIVSAMVCDLLSGIGTQTDGNASPYL